ncbi:unnamed protein product, partial [Prorocentrum cordatum]
AQLVSAAGAATGAARGRPCPWRSGTCSSRPRQLRGRSGAAAGQLRQPGRGARRAAGGSCLLVAHQLGDGVAPAREALAAGRPRAPRRGGPGGAAALQGAGGGEPGPLPPAGAGEHRLRLGPAAGEAGDPLDTGLCALGGCRGQLQRAGGGQPAVRAGAGAGGGPGRGRPPAGGARGGAAQGRGAVAAGEASNTLYALALLRQRCEAALAGVCGRAQGALPEFSPQGLANAAYALGLLSVRAPAAPRGPVLPPAVEAGGLQRAGVEQGID